MATLVIPATPPSPGSRTYRRRVWRAVAGVYVASLAVTWVLLRQAHDPVVRLAGAPEVPVLAGFAAAGLAIAVLYLLLTERLWRSLEARRDTEALYTEVVTRSSDGIALVDPVTRVVVRANESLERMLGHRVTGGELGAVLRLPHSEVEATLAALGPGERATLGVVEHADAGGTLRALRFGVSCLRVDERAMLCLVAQDVSDAQRDAERARWFAYHDTLTGLPNRLLFQDRLGVAVAQAERAGEHLAVVFVDLDHFKDVNDTLGHDEGDRLLEVVADRLQRCVRAGDTVARQGGDEFLVLLPRLGAEEEAGRVCERLLAAVRQPIVLAGREVYVGASVGLAVYPADARDGVALLHHADIAMYEAKEDCGDGWRRFEPGMLRRETHVLDMRSRLVRALEREEFRLVYQPQVETGTGRVVGVEALLRWHPADGPPVPPGDFIPAAEATGLIVPIGAWVLKAACAQMRAWQDAGLPPVRVAVNLSARQVAAPDIVRVVADAIATHGVDARMLELEVTESVAMRDVDAARAALTALKALGVTVALDDFGTGYSSLAYLRSLPLDRLKIDRSFLEQIEGDPRAQAMVTAIVALAHALGMEVAAEGVERLEQLEAARDTGCDLAQGYGLHRPAPAEALTDVLSGAVGLLAKLRATAA
ncbi:MAG: putative bifunctional diguanylate cyclase/phosphodiesterase [Myxococcota bacterium]